MDAREVSIAIGDQQQIGAILTRPESVRGLVIFAHGSGSGRRSPRNRAVAAALNSAGLATLLVDLLTDEEERIDERTGGLRFDIDLCQERLNAAVSWAVKHVTAPGRIKIGLFGASTGAAAALRVAARRGENIAAVVSRGGRPDLAGEALARVLAPTLFIVGGDDAPVLQLNQAALGQLDCTKRLMIVPRATHLFSEPGALEHVAALARQWFLEYLDGKQIALPGGEPALAT